MDEFELINHCFRERATRRPGTVLGIGDDAALLDIGGGTLAHARATAPFSSVDEPAVFACRVFGAAFTRLAARAITPRWATLGFTSEVNDAESFEQFAAATARVCDACGVELIGGDTTRGPGRATVFALGTENVSFHRPVPLRPATAVVIRLPLAAASAPEHAIANLVSICVDLAGSGAAIHCGDRPDIGGDARTLELTAYTNSAGLDALHAAAGNGALAAASIDAHG